MHITVDIKVAAAMLIAATRFMLLHGPDGQEYYINMDMVTALRLPIKNDLDKSYAKRTSCVVYTDDGKFLAAIETCEQIYKLIMTH